MNSIKKILILTLFSAISATPNYRYMLSYYAIEADKSGQMSATECQTMLQQSIYYNIISDKPVFREDKDALYKILNYNRLITTELNNHQTFDSKHRSSCKTPSLAKKLKLEVGNLR